MIDSLVYFLQDAEGRVKIGRSRLPMARLGEIVRSNGRAIELIGVIPGGKVLERALHISFAYLRLPPDASLGDGRTEWFILDDVLSAYIKANAQTLSVDASRKSRPQDYRPVLSEAARDALTEFAGELGFVVSTPSLYTGKPSVPDMLDALAAAYRRDPEGVALAFRVLGVVPPDATE